LKKAMKINKKIFLKKMKKTIVITLNML